MVKAVLNVIKISYFFTMHDFNFVVFQRAKYYNSDIFEHVSKNAIKNIKTLVQVDSFINLLLIIYNNNKIYIFKKITAF